MHVNDVPLGAWDVVAVAETTRYAERACKLMNEEERAAIVTTIAHDPACGDVIQGTGGVRKVRIPLQGRGKSGGARVIYYFHNESLPVYLFDVYAKNERPDLTPKQKKALAAAVAELVSGAKKP